MASPAGELCRWNSSPRRLAAGLRYEGAAGARTDRGGILRSVGRGNDSAPLRAMVGAAWATMGRRRHLRSVGGRVERPRLAAGRLRGRRIVGCLLDGGLTVRQPPLRIVCSGRWCRRVLNGLGCRPRGAGGGGEFCVCLWAIRGALVPADWPHRVLIGPVPIGPPFFLETDCHSRRLCPRVAKSLRPAGEFSAATRGDGKTPAASPSSKSAPSDAFRKVNRRGRNIGRSFQGRFMRGVSLRTRRDEIAGANAQRPP